MLRSPTPPAHHALARSPRRRGSRTRHSLLSVSGSLLASGLVVVLTAVAQPPAAHAAEADVGLGTSTSYAVLAGQSVSNTGPTVVSGDLGTSPGTAVTGFPPGLVQAGAVHAADAPALQAQNDVTTAYDDAAGRTPTGDQTDRDLGGQVLVAGAYRASSSMALTGTLTLDAQGDPDAVFIFQAGSTLTTASSSRVALINGAQACHVYWQVGSSATIGTTTTFVGTVLALTSITAQTGATVQGRLLARNGSVTLDSNIITRPGCAAPPSSTTSSAVPTTTPSSASPTTNPTATNPPVGTSSPGATTPPRDSSTPTAPPSDLTSAPPRATTPPWVPNGHPPTGRDPSESAAPTLVRNDGWSDRMWLGFGLIALGGLVGVASSGRRTRRLH